MWMRWNDSTHIFEQSFNDGASWAVLPLNASVINEGAINIARLPANLAVKDANNNFTASQSITGLLSVNVANGNSFVQGNWVGGVSLIIKNDSAIGASYTQLSIGNNVDASIGYLRCWSSGYAGAGVNMANMVTLASTGVGGLCLSADNASGTGLHLFTGGVERMRIQPTGELTINSTQAIFGHQITMLYDSINHQGMAIQNTNATPGNPFMTFYNSANGAQGSISQLGTTGVSFVTTSDMRLKDDDGRVEDLSALRQVIIHNFRWKADGIRDRGVFAQEAHELYPRAISKGNADLTENGDIAHPWGTDYSKFVPDLIAGWQEHDKEIAELKRLLNDKSLS